VLAAFSADTRAVSVSSILLRINEDDPPCLLASDSIGQLRDLDRIEVALSRRDEALPIEAAPQSASPRVLRLPATLRLRGLKRYPTAPPAAQRAAKAPSPSRDAAASPAADAAPASAEGASVKLEEDAQAHPAKEAKDDDMLPLHCFKVCEVSGKPLVVGAKPSGVREL
jgi:hypothetical protein